MVTESKMPADTSQAKTRNTVKFQFSEPPSHCEAIRSVWRRSYAFRLHFASWGEQTLYKFVVFGHWTCKCKSLATLTRCPPGIGVRRATHNAEQVRFPPFGVQGGLRIAHQRRLLRSKANTCEMGMVSKLGMHHLCKWCQ